MILDAFRKATRVIDSCETESHLAGANNYINNFLLTYADPTDEWIANSPMLEADEFSSTCYRRLRTALQNKKQEVSD